MTAPILFLAEFDPAGVLLGHRDLLRAAGIDARVALHHAYTNRHLDSDWIFAVATSDPSVPQSRPGLIGVPTQRYAPVLHDAGELERFAHEAGTIVVAPGIAQPWADEPQHDMANFDPPRAALLDRDWRWIDESKARRVAYFHGSINAWANVDRYVGRYRTREYHLATSTVDYAWRGPMTYLPPFVDVGDLRAPPRESDDPLVVAHCPTNPRIASTDEFMAICRRHGIIVNYCYGQSREASLRAKATSHLTFDHLRGCFSVNSLEAAAIRSAPIARIPASTFSDSMFGICRVTDLADLERTLVKFADDPALTAGKQWHARQWFDQRFSREAITDRLLRFYGEP